MKKSAVVCLLLAGMAFGVNEGAAFNLGGVISAAEDGVKAATLTDEDVVAMSKEMAAYSDRQNRVAPATDKYAKRLNRLTAKFRSRDGHTYNYKVYLSSTVNAFAMADGTIRVYSGLMDMMDDDELRFVLGHEMGHVVHGDSKKTISRAYAVSAVRKGVASQGGRAGRIAASELGGLMEQFINAQYSQSQETAADDYGFDFMKNHGFKVAASVSSLKKLAEMGGSSGLNFLSSHPEPGKRAKRLEERLK